MPFMLIVIIAFTLDVQSHCVRADVPHVLAENLDKGALFIPEGEFTLSGDSWILGLDISLADYRESIQWTIQAVEQFSNIKELKPNYSSNEQETIFNLYRQAEFLHDNARRVESQFSAILGTLTPSKRVPRGLFNVGGTILHSLFGVLDDSTLTEINSHINNLTTQSNNVVQVLQHQATIIRSNAKVGQNNRKEIESVELALNLINQKFKKFEEIMSLDMRTSTERIEHALQVNAAIREIEFHLNTVREDISNLATALIVTSRSQLSAYFLTPDNLLTILTQIKAHLPVGISFLTELDIHQMYQYYSLAIVTAAIQGMQLRLFVKIPLKSLETTFSYYKVIPFPVLFGNLSVAMYIQPKYRYLAISDTRQLYMEFDDISTLSCRHNKIPVCDPIYPLLTTSMKSCAYNLFMGNEKLVDITCNTHIIPHPEPTLIRSKSSCAWLFSAANDTVVIRCPDYGHTLGNITVVHLQGNGVLYVPARCTTHSPRFELRSHSQSSTIIGTLRRTFLVPPLGDILKRLNTSCPINKTSLLGTSQEVEQVLEKLKNTHERFKPVPLHTWTRELDGLRYLQSNDYKQYTSWFAGCGSIGGVIVLCVGILVIKRFFCSRVIQRASSSPVLSGNVIPLNIANPPVIIGSNKQMSTPSLWQTAEF